MEDGFPSFLLRNRTHCPEGLGVIVETRVRSERGAVLGARRASWGAGMCTAGRASGKSAGALRLRSSHLAAGPPRAPVQVRPSGVDHSWGTAGPSWAGGSHAVPVRGAGKRDGGAKQAGQCPCGEIKAPGTLAPAEAELSVLGGPGRGLRDLRAGLLAQSPATCPGPAGHHCRVPARLLRLGSLVTSCATSSALPATPGADTAGLRVHALQTSRRSQETRLVLMVRSSTRSSV